MKIDTTTIIDKLNKDKLLISKNIIDENCSYGDVRIDSRQIQKDDIFIAIKGLSVDGHDYIETAISKGASLIIHSTKCDIAINSILVKNSRKAGALITSELYDNPSHKTKLIGITGTNGKTTTTNILFDILTKAGVNCGRIGTLGYSFGNTTYSLQRTTPDITELNKILYDMVEYGCEVIIMEVSSHSLILDRVYGQKFSAVGFTNLTQDHLDFHKTFENYFQAKKIIFDMVQEAGGFAVINCDDLQGKLYFKHFNSTKFSYGKDDQSNYCFSDIKISSNLTSFKLSTGKKECLINTNYYGQFNIYNIVLAIALCKELLPNLQLEKNSFANLAPTAGRLEFISSQSLGHAFLDYAHTPDAIKNVLNTLAEMEHNRIITVVGCGGDRDRSKRPLMSKVACQLSDLVIFTDDNPRNEQGSAIIYDMLENNYSSNYIILRDRKRAISTALNLAKEGDLVAILGKGHELYQEVAGEKLPFSDRDVIEAFRTITPTEEIAIPYDILNLHDIIKKELDNSYNFRNITIPMIEVTNISTDSREIKDNNLFIALSGENFNGNAFCQKVLDSSNSTYAIGSIDIESPRYLSVASPVKFYGLLAKRYLKLFQVTKIAITGSTGKTTTKEILSSILSQSNRILKTFGNENNFIGLPRTIFRLSARDDYAVLEIGTNAFGEINYLSNIIAPDYAIVTSVDEAHLELLKSLEGIYLEKISLLKRRLLGFLFPADNPLFHEFKRIEYSGTGFSVGMNEEASFCFKIEDIEENRLKLKINNSHFNINSAIPYFGINYSYAISLAKMLNISTEDIIKSLAKELELKNRMSISQKGDLTIIADCYNANPKSTEAAILFWKSYKPHLKHYAILGDMLELGENSIELHNKIGELLIDAHHVTTYSVGVNSKLFDTNSHFVDVDSLIKSDVLNSINDGVLLIKASHGINLKKVLEYIQ